MCHVIHLKSFCAARIMPDSRPPITSQRLAARPNIALLKECDLLLTPQL